MYFAKAFILSIFIFLFFGFLFGQLQQSGFIVDQTTQQPIEYVNVGIVEKSIGTVCDQQGRFALVVSNDEENSVLTITRLGYQTTTISGIKFNDIPKVKIEMIPVVKELSEFTFSGKDRIELGYRPQDDAVKGYFKVEGLGIEGGTLIRNSDTVQLTSFNMNILELHYDSMKFRLNLYNLKKGRP